MPRKKPFSSKQKKIQLQEKRRRKKGHAYSESESDSEEETVAPSPSKEGRPSNVLKNVKKINQQPTAKHDENRYKLHFFKESNEEIKQRKELARKAIFPTAEKELEVDADIIYKTGTVLDLPKRQPWNYGTSKAALEAKEEKYFKEYIEKIFDEYPPEKLSYFEMNLETWRQLWRVLEMSDVVLLIIDIRYPGLHFSPALYHHVTEELGKHIILILNKIDLVPAEVVIAWKHFMLERYPKLNIVFFSSYAQFACGKSNAEEQAKKRRRYKGNRWRFSSGALDLYAVCHEIVKDKVNLSSWHHKIHQDMSGVADGGDDETDDEAVSCVDKEEEVQSRGGEQRPMFKDGILTIGCVGYPNVGKSSLLNGLMRKKVVSVSKTPGHTKHFQTIFLTPTVKLCDCPGLVFPSLVDKPLQILSGIYPIAQVREPYTPVGYLASRVNVIKQLKLSHPSGVTDESTAFEKGGWSAMDICEAWALKRGFLTAKASRPDVYRAANNLLRMALDGRICLSLKPPGFFRNLVRWQGHGETKVLVDKLMQFQEKDIESGSGEDDSEDDDDIDVEKDEYEAESSSEGEEEENIKDKGFACSNPYELLGDD